MQPEKSKNEAKSEEVKDPKLKQTKTAIDEMLDIDFVPPSIPADNYLWKHRAKLVICEDNDAVITMCSTGRSTTMRHLLRVHRVILIHCGNN